MAYIYVPPQRAELKPFVVKGVVVSGSIRAAHVSIPVRDGEDTRYADPTEVHSLLQAGRVALQQLPAPPRQLSSKQLSGRDWQAVLGDLGERLKKLL